MTDTSVTGTPVTGTPVTGTPVTGTPVTGTPVTGTPVTGTSVTGAPLPSAGATAVASAPVGQVTPAATAPPQPTGLLGDAAPAVTTSGLTKRFRGHLAVDAIGLEVPAGAVYGFLGPNGSGKTTTIRMLLGLIQADAGTMHLLGEPMPGAVATVLPRVGALVEGPAFHPYLSGRANLARIDAADRAASPRTAPARIDAALDRVGLLAAAAKRYRAYSLGMRQRLAIASALLMPRDLLVLDEPTNGLDPQGTREVRHLVAGLAAEGATVVVSSHLLSEVEQMCSHIGVMHEGRLLRQGTIGDFRAGTEHARVRVDTPRTVEAAQVLERLGLSGVAVGSGQVTAALGELAAEDQTSDGSENAVRVNDRVDGVVPALVHAGIPVRGFALETPSLEDVFVSLTGEGFDVSG